MTIPLYTYIARALVVIASLRFP